MLSGYKAVNGGAAALSKCRSFFCIVNYD